MNNSFEERLRRLEQKNGVTPSASSPLNPIPSKPRGEGSSNALPLMILAVGVLLLGGAALVFALKASGGRDLASEFAHQFHALSPGLTTLNNGPENPSETAVVADQGKADADVASLIFQSDIGALVVHPAAATLGDVVDVRNVVSGYRNTRGATGFAKTIPIPAQKGCTFRKVGAGEKPYLVTVETGFPTAPVLALNKTDIAQGMMKMVREVHMEKRRNFTLSSYTAVGHAAMTNVYVTDTSAPLYLVLHSGSFVIDKPPAMIWNLHIAPGVEIAHVTIAAVSGVGVVLPQGIEIPVTIASRVNAADPSNCMPQMFRKPDNGWTKFTKAQKGNTMAQNFIDTAMDRYGRYAGALSDKLGLAPDVAQVSVFATDHAMVGPKPAVRMAYQWPDDNTLRITGFDHLEFGTYAQIGPRVLELHNQVVTAAIGADWNAALPQPRELTQ